LEPGESSFVAVIVEPLLLTLDLSGRPFVPNMGRID
jgi:hypothetical protein